MIKKNQCTMNGNTVESCQIISARTIPQHITPLKTKWLSVNVKKKLLETDSPTVSKRARVSCDNNNGQDFWASSPRYVEYNGTYYHGIEFLSIQQGKVYMPSTSRNARWMAVSFIMKILVQLQHRKPRDTFIATLMLHSGWRARSF